MIKKLLVANRGEIACRILTTAQRMGIKTVAVFSDADAQAKHVALADEAVRIGPAEAAQSYLDQSRILAAAKTTGADAIHPGYGFLSENPDFVDAVVAAGLIFVGPPASAIRAMGLKDAAKALMEKAGVPVVPGYHGTNQDPDFLRSEATRIGYPVLIKARAGGGGKGMRLVETADEFDRALDAAQNEAQAAFGDPACLIEKYITQPRHIEIQVFGDAHGNVVHLFERDCSLQRRHQKVIEEAPAPNMPPKVRDAMAQAAVRAAQAIGYQNAGTVEFIVDGTPPLREDGFWFMEMNTRLQVEHPVSEAITGLDFVELQLRVAGGQSLPFEQSDLAIDGWSMEARLYAEDVPGGFLPATGRVTQMHLPDGSASFEIAPLRIDSGIRDGDEVSIWYDPMIAKVITHGPNRAAARAQLVRALEQIRITGCTTNVSFLTALADHAGFSQGDVDTGLIARDLQTLIQQPEPTGLQCGLAAVAAAGLLPADQPDPWDQMTAWRHWGPAEHVAHLTHSGDMQAHRIVIQGPKEFEVDGEVFAITPHQGGYRVQQGDHQEDLDLHITQDNVIVYQGATRHAFGRIDPLTSAEADTFDADRIMAPMPGLVSALFVEPGTSVKQGDDLVILEAMKMEHRLQAPRDGTVKEVLCASGTQVENGAILVQLDDQS